LCEINQPPLLHPTSNSNSGGFVGDCIGRLNLLYPVTLNLGLLCTVWLLSTSIEALVVFCCLFGFFSGMFVGLIPPAVSQISPDEKLGARIGAFYSVIAISSLIGTPVGGALIKGDAKSRTNYQNVILYAVSARVR
jgi:MFS family permease